MRAPARLADAAGALLAQTIDVVVLCGGRGTRLGMLTTRTPKPLLSVAGAPFLWHLLRRLREQGFARFVLAAQYLAEQVEAFAAAVSQTLPGVEVEVVVEPQPLGTGGSLREAVQRVHSSRLLALNGDSFVEQPLAPVIEAHERAGNALTLVAVRADRVEGGARRKALCRVTEDGRLIGFETIEEADTGWVNGGMYVIEREAALSWPRGRYSLEANLLQLLNGRRAGMWPSPASLLDIGTPECYRLAQARWTA